MKKGWKIIGAVAALVALLPYSVKKDEEADEMTVQALLWTYTNQPDRETPDRRNISINIGFHKPMADQTIDPPLMDDNFKAPVQSEV